MIKKHYPKTVPVTVAALEEQLQDQVAFLERSCAAFDEGYTDEFKRLAVTIRVLVHDTAKSRSLLSQLDIKNQTFFAYSRRITGQNLIPDWPLAIVRMDANGVHMIPALDNGRSSPRELSFDDWWSEAVYRDLNSGVMLSRKAMVLSVANKDGGAHVDPEIDEAYSRLVNNGSGLVAYTQQGPTPIEDLEKVCLRHIAFEVLNSIRPVMAKRVGNRGCECGSGRKHRYCCGRMKLSRPGSL